MEQKMTVKEAERLGIMKELERRKITYQEGSEILELSRRQTIRLMKRYRAEGAQGIVSRRKGKASPKKIPLKKKLETLKIIRRKYLDFGPTFASEKLIENHKINIPRETLRKWLIEEGIWKPKRKKEQKIHPRRTRRSQIGELIQIDGSYHHWFEKRGEKCCLLLFIRCDKSNYGRSFVQNRNDKRLHGSIKKLHQEIWETLSTVLR